MSRENLGEKLLDDWVSTLSEEECEAIDEYLKGFVKLGFDKAKEKTSYNGYPIDKYWSIDDFYKTFIKEKV